VRFYDVEQERAPVFSTNHFGLPALTVSRLYCLRWRVVQRGAHAIVDRGERLHADGHHPQATQN
jgi:hypothetical protein